jgi:hypothetical protein
VGNRWRIAGHAETFGNYAKSKGLAAPTFANDGNYLLFVGSKPDLWLLARNDFTEHPEP